MRVGVDAFRKHQQHSTHANDSPDTKDTLVVMSRAGNGTLTLIPESPSCGSAAMAAALAKPTAKEKRQVRSNFVMMAYKFRQRCIISGEKIKSNSELVVYIIYYSYSVFLTSDRNAEKEYYPTVDKSLDSSGLYCIRP